MSQNFSLCTLFRRLKLIGCPLALVMSYFAVAEPCRAPASVFPQEDEILRPYTVELSFMDSFHRRHKQNMDKAKITIERWLKEEEYAESFGQEDAPYLNLPTEEDKMEFFHQNYLRFLSRDMEKMAQSTIQTEIDSWEINKEIDAIDSVDARQQTIIKIKKDQGKKLISRSKTVVTEENYFEFGTVIRPEIGMVNFAMRSNLFNATVWLGANGNQEFKVDRKFKRTGTRLLSNYYIDDKRLLWVADQKLSKHWSLRLSHTQTELESVEDFKIDDEERANNILQFQYTKKF